MDMMLRSFDRYEDAVAARERLLAAGLPDAAVQLRVTDDDGGPVEGNFVCGNGSKPRVTDVVGRPALEPPVYDQDFARQVARGAHLLLVSPTDEAQRGDVERLLAGYSGCDVASRTARG